MCVFQARHNETDITELPTSQHQPSSFAKYEQTNLNNNSEVVESSNNSNNKNNKTTTTTTIEMSEKRNGTTNGGAGPSTSAGAVTAGTFGIKLDELRDLMQTKGQEAKEKINESFDGVAGLAKRLNTSILSGLTGDAADLSKRVSTFGKNEIPPKPPKSIFVLAFEALQDTTLVMLMLCSIISIGLSFYHPEADVQDEDVRTTSEGEANLEWIEGVAILIAVIVVVSVTAFNDWRKERQFRGLKDRIEKDHLASVIRKGEIIQINVKELVVGDICCIKYGDLVPADGVIVQASDLKIDESSLTGETDLIKKTETDNLTVLSGTHVMEGSGRVMVTAVGLNSQTGIIMTLLGATQEEEDGEEEKKAKKEKNKKENSKSKVAPHPAEDSTQENKPKANLPKKASSKKQRSVLQTKLGKLALQIGYGGMIGAGFTFLILVVRMAIEEFAINKKTWSNIYVKYIISYLIQAITVIVVAVPEGLPLAVTLALAFAVRKMTRDNNLVRHLDACETMGNATTICSDKTGTLTTNRMTVVQCWLGDEYFKKVPAKDTVNDRIKDLVFNSIAINSNYTSMNEPSTQPGDLPKQIGNKTECGLLGLVTDLGGDYGKIRAQFPNDQFTKCYTFNSARKMMSTIVKIEEGHYRVYSKGASEMVLSKCKYFLDKSGNVAPMSKDKCDSVIRDVVEAMASEALRTICVAYRDFKSKASESNGTKSEVYYYDSEPDWEDEPDIVADMVCICLTGIEDPVRDEVPDAIKKCQTSGVVVRMVTGDNIATATSIALKCGIIRPSDDFLILESKEFNRRIRDPSGDVQQDLLDKVWPRLRVLARSSPQDKYILVNGIVESKISANREVVAVTGDGTNDGPALKRADVGFAMGIQGTDVAKEASDIILTDDNFSSIVKAMMWGRNVYDAIAKFLQFQLTANVAAGLFSVVCAATIQAVPLKAIQMLWVNLVMDTLASLALATEPPTEDLLKRKPYGRTKALISSTILKNILGHSIYQLAILFALVWGIEDWMQVDSIIAYHDINKLREPNIHFTIIFNAFVLMTLFNEINARKIHNERNVFQGIQKNSIFIGIWVSCFCGQILIVNFGGVVFGVERLDWDHWMWCLLFGVGSLVWGQVVTSIPDKVIKRLKKACCCCCLMCKKKKKEKAKSVISVKEDPQNAAPPSDEKDDEESDDDDEIIDMSKLRWVRGANRIQSQLQVVEAFRYKLNDAKQAGLYGSLSSLRSSTNDLKKLSAKKS